LDCARYNSGVDAKTFHGEPTLKELAAYAENMSTSRLSGSGKQERLEAIVNQVLFG